jgi:hypothetical protein
MAPMMSIGGLPAAAKRSRNARPQAVRVRVTLAGIYSALRNSAWPTLDKRGFPRTLLPD